MKKNYSVRLELVVEVEAENDCDAIHNAIIYAISYGEREKLRHLSAKITRVQLPLQPPKQVSPPNYFPDDQPASAPSTERLPIH